MSFRRRLPVFTALLVFSAAASFAKSGENQEPDPIYRFRSYLRIKTAHPNPDYAAAVNHLASYAATIPALRTRTLYLTSPEKPLLLVTWPGSDPSLPAILLNSHLDSVPAEPSKWTHDPFGGHVSEDDGKIFGRGAQDDKSIGMQYLEAIRNLIADSDYAPARTVHVSYVPDEEIGGSDGMGEFARSEEFGKLNVGFVLDEFRVFYADRSPWNLVIRAVGLPGHGSTMHDHSAVENLMKSVEVIMKFRENSFDLVKAGLAASSEVVSVNPVFLKAGMIMSEAVGGFVMNVQPSEAEAGFDIRMPPMADPEVMRKRIADEWAPSWRNMSYQITEKGPLRDASGRPLMTATDDTNPWWSLFEGGVASAGGKLGKPEILPSTTDARFVRQLGIPCLGFSPMKNTPILLHDHDEFLKEDVYLEGIRVYQHIIRWLSADYGQGRTAEKEGPICNYSLLGG
ncbi:hypothetical protein M569_08749 [Genlisea aurea]|uniref:Peptidase M20 dimerisation domain-containing protein n=1 Tax=Genlisea aurea TaxID=192259 RepID=S8CGF5_9LAMI|nr:hypothetical protein M569_08749 [Genlisea aurea]